MYVLSNGLLIVLRALLIPLGHHPAAQLELGMDHLGRLYAEQTGIDLVHVAGSGAAGGIGGALHAWMGAKLTKVRICVHSHAAASS